MQIAVQIALKQCEFGLLFSLMLLNGCSKSSSEITTVDIKVEKEVFLPGVARDSRRPSNG